MSKGHHWESSQWIKLEQFEQQNESSGIRLYPKVKKKYVSSNVDISKWLNV